MKLTKAQIDRIIKNTHPELKGQNHGSFILAEELGSYTPTEANWSFRAGWTNNGDLVVIRFGEIM